MLGQEIGALFIKVGADVSGLKAGLTEGAGDVEGFSAKVNSGIASLAKFGAALAAVAAVTVAAGLYEAAKAAGDFQASMKLLQTQAGASATEVANMSGAVLGLAGQVGTGPEDLAKGLYHIESAGFRGAKALQALQIAAEGAKVGQANLEDVTNALDAVLVAGVPEASNMTAAMGELNAIVGAGDMRMQDLADAMGTGILATAKTFGLSLKDVGAALAVFGDNNIRGSMAATKLRMAVSLMGAPSKAAQDALKKVGITATELGMDLRTGGLPKALADLKGHLEKTFGGSAKGLTQQADILSQAFGGGKSAGAIMLLMQQLDRLNNKEAEVGKGAGAFGSAWQATTQNLSFKVDAAKAAFEAFGIKIGTKLLPPLGQLLDFVTPLIPKLADMASTWLDKAIPAVEGFAGWLKSLRPDFQKAYDIITTLKPYLIEVGALWVAWNVALAVTKAYSVASMILGVANGLLYLVRTQGLATTAQWLLNIAMDANPIGVVIIGLGLLAAAFIWAYQNIAPFRDAVNGVWGYLQQFGAWIGNVFGPLMQGLGQIFSDIGKGNWSAVMRDISRLHFGNYSFGQGGSAIAASTSMSKKGRVGGIQSFDTGGIVPGAIGAPMLAYVHGGERVLTPAQQASGGGNNSPEVARLLSAILNELRTPPGGQTGVEAALYKATHLAGMNRARGMAGA